MKREFNSLVENKTWELTDRADHNVITGRWAYKLKKNREGNILRYKIRWVVHDYKQHHEVDFDETFATVVKPISYKILMAISVKKGLFIRHMDVVTAFLYELLDEEVYVIQSMLFETEDRDKMCRLKKALYDLKQAPKVWYDTIHKFLQQHGFKRVESDHAVFISLNGRTFIAIYVDDLLLFEPNLESLTEIQKKLKENFKMTDLGELSHYLGMKITISLDKNAISLRQRTYMKKILRQFEMKNCNPVSTPMKTKVAETLIFSAMKADSRTVK